MLIVFSVDRDLPNCTCLTFHNHAVLAAISPAYIGLTALSAGIRKFFRCRLGDLDKATGKTRKRPVCNADDRRCNDDCGLEWYGDKLAIRPLHRGKFVKDGDTKSAANERAGHHALQDRDVRRIGNRAVVNAFATAAPRRLTGSERYDPRPVRCWGRSVARFANG